VAHDWATSSPLWRHSAPTWKLYQATRKRAQEPKRNGFPWRSEQLHDYVLFAVNTGLRPDEAGRIEFRDVTIVDDEDLCKTILEIEVRGKRGVGYCKSMPGAVRPFVRLRRRHRPARFWREHPTKTSVTSVGLSDNGARTDGPYFCRSGSASSSKPFSSLRIMEGADIDQIVKNFRTTVEMIEKFYEARIKTRSTP
jgi:hypothetical protein